MTLGALAGLIAAIAFAVLVALCAVPLLKLGRVLEEVRLAVRDLGQESVPILTELRSTVTATNAEIEKLGTVTEDVARVSQHASTLAGNAAQLSSLLTAAVGLPLVKLAALGSAIRRGFCRRPRSIRAEPVRAEPVRAEPVRAEVAGHAADVSAAGLPARTE